MAEQKTEFRSRDRWLMFAFILGPMSVLTHLNVSYALVPTSCAQGDKTLLHVSTAVFLLLAAAAALIGWRIYGRFANGEAELWRERTRWFSMFVIALSISSMVVILAMEIPNLILRSCD
ncbi:MAG: hypothetical protein QOJ98_3019 [Acidobacteriota bacterium]|jgi:hypothetical protein|nr:hypothetical protein [Acidobacteriota bacterium]